jgi:hypothetical protein
MGLNLVQSDCEVGDFAGIPYDEFSSIMIVCFSSIIGLIAIRLILKKGQCGYS